MSLQPICRIGDQCTGTCQVSAPGHPRTFTATWQTGSSDMFDGIIPLVRVGDTGITDCGHTVQATGGSSVTKNNGIPVHRVTDAVIVLGGGFGVSITGSAIWSSEA